MGGFNPIGVTMVLTFSMNTAILSPAVCFYPIINATGLLKLTSTLKAGFFVAIIQILITLFIMFTIGKLLNFV